MKQEDLLQAEVSLIAYIINDQKAYLENASLITEDLFSIHSATRPLYKAFKELLENSQKTDVFSLSRSSGISASEITSILTNSDYYQDIESLISVLRENYIKQKLNSLALQIQIRVKNEDPTSDVISEIEQILGTFINTKQEQFRSIFDTTKDIFEQIDRNVKGNRLTGVPYGINWLDEFTGGMHGGDLIVLAGRTSQGKTAFALSTAYKAVLKRGMKIGFWSLEMSDIQLSARMLSYASELSSKEILYRQMTTEVLDSFHVHIKNIITKPFYIAQCLSSKTADIVNSIRLLKLQKNIDLAIVDYLQLISTGEKINKEQDVAKTARVLKNLAKELDIPIILISQLHRPQGNVYRPSLHDLRDSGQIEEAADVVLFVYRPEYYGIETIDMENTSMSSSGIAIIDLAKGRNVGITKGFSKFNSHTTLFSEYEEVFSQSADF